MEKNVLFLYNSLNWDHIKNGLLQFLLFFLSNLKTAGKLLHYREASRQMDWFVFWDHFFVELWSTEQM